MASTHSDFFQEQIHMGIIFGAWLSKEGMQEEPTSLFIFATHSPLQAKTNLTQPQAGVLIFNRYNGEKSSVNITLDGTMCPG
jgi:hypothetical protein